MSQACLAFKHSKNSAGPLQRVQICQQVADLLLVEDLGVARHFVAAQTDDVGDAIVIRGHAAHRQILSAEDAFHAGPLPATRRVWRVAAIA